MEFLQKKQPKIKLFIKNWNLIPHICWIIMHLYILGSFLGNCKEVLNLQNLVMAIPVLMNSVKAT